MSSYVNLHSHTVYSLLDGLGKVDDYVERAVALGMPAIAITDHGNLHGWLSFHDACKKADITPILGIEAYQARKTRFDRDEEELAHGKANDELAQRGPLHLTLLARNHDGYRNLIKLSSRAFTEGFYGKPRIDHELLAEHANGLIVLSGCLNGEVNQHLLLGDYDSALLAASRMQDMVGKDHYFVEIHDHGLDEQRQVIPGLVKLSKDLGAPLVPAGDCHYVNREDSSKHDLYLCVSTGATIHDEGRFAFRPEEFHLKSYEEMRERFEPEWLANTLAVAEQVELELSFGELHFPDFDIPTEETVDEYLERNVWEGIRNRYGDPIPEEVRERTEHELGVVKRMGFQEYFLVVSDLVNWAKNDGIRVGYGRGSAAGSILSYALRITDLDPLRFGLLFERFLVEGRKSMPDIDIDIDDRYRDRVIQYARQKYGADRVAHIATFQSSGAKAAVKDATRSLGLEYAVGERVNKAHPPPVLGVSKSLDQALEGTKEFRKLYDSDKDARLVIDNARGLEGALRSSGIHAAGVVIAKEAITNFVPVMQRPDKDTGEQGPLVTQWDMYEVERCGQLKIDFLGLRNLGVVDRCLEHVKQRHDLDVDLQQISLKDEKTYHTLRQGKTQGVFQMESGGMKALMLALQPQSIEDLMATMSLYRPGPLGSGMDKMYVERRHGRQQVKYYHPVLADVLDKTYGIMLYQEDIMRVSRVLAGFDVGEADDLRKVIGKKLMDQIGLFRDRFVQGCRDTHNVHPDIANKIYSDIEYFGGYGFNLSHAAAYGMLAYVTAYLKSHYPAEYMAGLLSSVKKADRAAPYLAECRSMQITVTPPSINRSTPEFSVESDDEIVCGFSAVAGIGDAIISAIMTSRNMEKPYQSMYDFMRRVNPDVLNKSSVESLVFSGAFDELIDNVPVRSMSRDEKLSILDSERKKLGLYITDHPLTGVWHLFEPQTDAVIGELDSKTDGQTVILGGIISAVTQLTTRRGQKMYRFDLEDLSHSVEVIVFPKQAESITPNAGEAVLLTGRVQHEGEDESLTTKIIYQDMKVPVLPQDANGEPIVLQFPNRPHYGILQQMEQVIEDTPGDCSVYVEYNEGDYVVTLQFKRPAALTAEPILREMLQ